MKPLVSIIIPCYNYAQYLGEAIESALAQTYHPIEIIVVNDGSTDNTIGVASRYPVTLFTQENQGAANTFNKGIDLAHGKYLVILSADDKLHPSFIEKTLSVLERDNNIAFVYTHVFLFGARNGILLSRDYDLEMLKMTNYITGTALTRKEAFQIGGNFDPALGYEDYDLWLSFAEKKLYGKLVPAPLLYYRQQISSRNTMSLSKYFHNSWKIWRKHTKLYTWSDILRITMIICLHKISVFILELMKGILPVGLRKNLSKVDRKLKTFRGFEFIPD